MTNLVRKADMTIVGSEEWRAIPGFPGYEASSLGSVRSLDRRVFFNDHPRNLTSKSIRGVTIRPRINRYGYPQVIILRKTIPVHRCVASAFLGLIPAHLQVNHKNAVKTDNRIENLELVTPDQNIQHEIENELGIFRGESSYVAKLTNEKVREIRSILGKTNKEIASLYGMSWQHIRKIRLREAWSHLE